jgi:hypothetical protein
MPLSQASQDGLGISCIVLSYVNHVILPISFPCSSVSGVWDFSHAIEASAHLRVSCVLCGWSDVGAASGGARRQHDTGGTRGGTTHRAGYVGGVDIWDIFVDMWMICIYD